MVERLRSAIAKAREQRTARPSVMGAPRQVADPTAVESAWSAIRPLDIDPARLARARLVALDESAPEHATFGMMRTMILRACRDHGLRRIAITSPTPSCGKTFMALNLALSISRRDAARALLLDLDLRRPAHAKLLGVGDPTPMAGVLSGLSPAGDALRRLGGNLALCPNAAPYRRSAELLSDPAAAAAIDAMETMLAPDVVVIDLPPILSCDDVIAAAGLYDAVLLIAAAGRTSGQEIAASERLIAEHSRFLGVVLNMAERSADTPYGAGGY